VLPPPLPFGLVLDRLKRDDLLLTMSRRSPWKQVLVKRLGAKKLPCACIREAFMTD
jgi:hypothetical protein